MNLRFFNTPQCTKILVEPVDNTHTNCRNIWNLNDSNIIDSESTTVIMIILIVNLTRVINIE